MMRRSFVGIALAILVLALLGSEGVSAKKPDCSKMTDADIVAAIYAKLQTKYGDQMNHVNVRSTNGDVTIEGWATTKKVVKDIGKMAKKISCVKTVANNLTVGAGGGCGPNEKPCGTICIPKTETCNIRG